MILELLFELLFGVVDFILSLIPDFNFNIDFSLLNPLTGILKYLDVIVDVRVLLAIISIVLVRDNFVFLKNLFLFVIKKIPFIN